MLAIGIAFVAVLFVTLAVGFGATSFAEDRARAITRRDA